MEVIWDVISEIVFELVCATTGHVLVWIVTLGRGSIENESAKFLGMGFWIFIILLTALDPGVWHRLAHTLHLVA